MANKFGNVKDIPEEWKADASKGRKQCNYVLFKQRGEVGFECCTLVKGHPMPHMTYFGNIEIDGRRWGKYLDYESLLGDAVQLLNQASFSTEYDAEWRDEVLEKYREHYDN